MTMLMTNMTDWLEGSRAILVALVLAMLFGVLLAWRIAIMLRSLRTWWSRWRGRSGESQAVALLNSVGYQVCEEQATQHASYLIDGVEVGYVVRADFIVTKNGLRFVAEVKNGTQAADPRTRTTRRQLLEYSRVFPVDGVLLVDVPQRRVRRVEFPT